jgi:hypothetical protein
MNTSIYTDGITNIGLKKGMVRVEFGTLSISGEDAKGNPEVFSRCQLFFTPQVFLETFGNMERMLHKLIEAGVIRRKGEGERRGGPARDTEAAVSAKDRRQGDRDRRDNNLEIAHPPSPSSSE